MCNLDEGLVTLGANRGVVCLPEIDDLGDEGLAEDDVVRFDVKVADS